MTENIGNNIKNNIKNTEKSENTKNTENIENTDARNGADPTDTRGADVRDKTELLSLSLDEVRALEDLPPLGVNFIKLGLNDVLLDPVTNKIYTPNTNAMVDLGSGEGAVKTEPVDGSTL